MSNTASSCCLSPAPTSAWPLDNLVYTVAFDPAGHGGTRQLAKMLAASLVRTHFGGRVIVFRNSGSPLFLTLREGLEEIYVETPDFGAESQAESQAGADYAMAWKPKARQWIDAERYGWVAFLDADCLVLRNLDHLFPATPPGGMGGFFVEGDADILYQVETGRSVRDDVFSGYWTDAELPGARRRGVMRPAAMMPAGPQAEEQSPAPVWALPRHGVNSGTWAVRGAVYREVMEHWEAIMEQAPRQPTRWREQSAWNRLIADCRAGRLPWKARPFEAGEVQFPLHLDKDWKRYKEAAVLHAVSGTPKEKIEFLFGMFLQRFYGDETTTLVNVLEI